MPAGFKLPPNVRRGFGYVLHDERTRMHHRIESALSILLTVAAVVIAISVAHREFVRAQQPVATFDRQGPPQYIDDWEAMLASGIHIGRADAPVKIVEFSDLECPFCRQFHASVRDVRRQFGDSVALVFVHFPLSSHRFARPAARAVECAYEQGRVAEMIDVLYEKQDSLGLKSWASYAREADIADTAHIATCATDTVRIERIEAGLKLTERYGVNATPTVIINGWRYPSAPNGAQLASAVRAVLSGRPPHDSVAIVSTASAGSRKDR